jgi:hypothetical protein
MQRIPMERLNSPGRLPLTEDEVALLAHEWARRTDVDRASCDIQILADRFLRCDPADVSTATLAWHHLLMAIGNFKRRGGFIVAQPLVEALGQPADRPSEIIIPGLRGNDAVVVCHKPSTWPRLNKIRGLGVPTATTVLASIWPNSHVIMDSRDTRAALGLGADTLWNVNGLERAQFPDRSRSSQWRLYCEWFQPTTMQTAVNKAPLAVERALFRLDERTIRGLAKHGRWTWTEYRQEALRNLGELNDQ